MKIRIFAIVILCLVPGAVFARTVTCLKITPIKQVPKKELPKSDNIVKE